MKKILALLLIAALFLVGVAALAEAAEEEAVELNIEEDFDEEEDEPIPEGARVVKPIPVELDLNNLPDGVYPVYFYTEDLEDGGLTLTIYTVDRYDDAEISTLAVGDFIFIEDSGWEVRSLERNEYGDLLINGGIDEGGDVLAFDEADKTWRVSGLDDYPTWTEAGEVTLPFDDDVTFTDSWDIEKDPVTAAGVEEVTKAIQSSENEDFDEYGTTVKISSGKIAEIVRVYTP